MNKLFATFAAVFALLYAGLLGCGDDNTGDAADRPLYYTVTFDSQGGSEVQSKQVLKDNPVKRPDTPTRDGYFLTGWFTSSNAEWRFDTDRVNDNITLYAGWSAESLLGTDEEISEMYLSINGNKLTVKLEKNSSVDALIERLKQGDIVYTADDYGGFEKVGQLGFSLPTSNEQITTSPGDVILYSGNQIVLFYGSNSWSYTRLGKIEGYTTAQLRSLLGAGNGKVSVTLSLQ